MSTLPFDISDLDAEMRRIEKASGLKQSDLEAALNDGSSPESAVDNVNLVKAAWGFNSKPFPLQEFILKVFHRAPLSNVLPENPDERIRTWDRFKTECTGEYTEEEFLDFLHQEGRCNLSLEEYKKFPGKPFTLVNLRLGRRSGKTTVCRWIVGHRIYKTLKYDCPQEKFGILPEQSIGVTMVSLSKDRAQKLLAPLRKILKKSHIITGHIDKGKDSTETLGLRTKTNIREGDNSDSGIQVTALPCSSRTIRGDANLIVLLEEFGLFHTEAKDRSDKEIYRAISPSVAGFKDPETGYILGTVFIASTPSNEQSYQYRLEQLIFRGELTNSLSLNLPSYWVNPLLDSEELKNEYVKDPLGFVQEFDAEYSDAVTKPFSKTNIESCRLNLNEGYGVKHKNEKTYMGVDTGFINDGCSISIIAHDGKLGRLVHQEYHHKDIPGTLIFGEPDEDLKRIAARVDELWNYWSCHKGYADMHEWAGLKSHLSSAAKRNLEDVVVSANSNDKLARYFISSVHTRSFLFYEPEEAWEDENSVCRELFRLQKTQSGGDPPKYKLSATGENHDDQYSSISRALWAAHVFMEEKQLDAGMKSPVNQSRLAKMKERAEMARYMRQNSVKKLRQTGIR